MDEDVLSIGTVSVVDSCRIELDDGCDDVLSVVTISIVDCC